jgi:hypothetical protein
MSWILGYHGDTWISWIHVSLDTIDITFLHYPGIRILSDTLRMMKIHQNSLSISIHLFIDNRIHG